jgi:hypothetical protein
MRVATTVFSYAGGQEIVDRHLPIWRSVSDDLTLVYPEDSPNRAENVRHLATGRSCKYGDECLLRQLHGMRRSLDMDADYYVFLEYDAFLLRRPQPRVGLQANAFKNHARGYKGRFYKAPFYFHFPWIFDAASLRLFVENATLEPREHGFVDRWLQCQIARAGIPVHDLRRLREGYSRNTIRGWWEIQHALWLAGHGTYAFHGVKSAPLLDRILRAATRSS